jgi:phage terminase large subunit
MGGTAEGGVRKLEIAYEPLRSQRRFHESTARFKGFSGPIGSGKSQALCQEAVKLTYVNAGRTGLLGAPTYPMLRDATQTALLEILDRNRIPYEHNKAENALLMKDTRSRILFRPVDEFERLRGTNLAWFGLDELTYTQEAAWQRLEGRLRDPQAKWLCGFAVWTPKGFDWVYQKFIADPVKGYEAIIASPRENRFLLQQTPDFYDRLQASYDETFFRQEVMGEYLNLSGGKVYSGFNRQDHLVELKPNPYLPLYWALDFNVDPMSSVVVQVVGGVVQVLDEIVLRRAGTLDACREFLRRYPEHAAGVTVYGDASGNAQRTTGFSDYQIVRDYFRVNSATPVRYKVPKSNPAVRDRVGLVNAKFRTGTGDVQMVVDPRCKELIKDFEQVSYKTDTNEIDKDRDRRRTHLSDALGYLIWEECRPMAPVGERGERLL